MEGPLLSAVRQALVKGRTPASGWHALLRDASRGVVVPEGAEHAAKAMLIARGRVQMHPTPANICAAAASAERYLDDKTRRAAAALVRAATEMDDEHP